MRLRTNLLLAGLALAGCSDDSASGRGVGALALERVSPEAIVPGTRVTVEGRGFVESERALASLHLVGTLDGHPVDALIPTTFEDAVSLRVKMTRDTMHLLGMMGTGVFDGTASVQQVLIADGFVDESLPVELSLGLHESLVPHLESLEHRSTIFVDDRIEVRGAGLLLGGDEGDSVAVLEGCFRLADADECEPVSPASIPLTPTMPDQRVAATFPFSPYIAGIEPGTFEGQVHLENRHASGTVHESEALPITVTTVPPRVMSLASSGSLGKYVDVTGGGFIAGDEALTILHLDGTFIDDTGKAIDVDDLQVIPEVVDGNLARYILRESDGLGMAVDLRDTTGVFEGTVAPSVEFRGDEVRGSAHAVVFELEPVKQVVWVQFKPTYVDSLEAFGLRALDSKIRERVLTVLRRDYATINVEYRTEEPTDFYEYSIVELGGVDPNGYGLLGYDNTHGKDDNNQRLYDRIGGQNARVQEDFPGFGGVFVESIFTFSEHPPSGDPSGVASPVFDQIFDPFRPDVGTPVTGQDLGGTEIPTLASAGSCPTQDRRLQMSCAVWALGSVIGSTTSHEVGHSLGLAPPYVDGVYHYSGDEPNRLMDNGGARPFEERAELKGQGPSQFCTGAYDYLRGILPTDEPDDREGRPPC